MEESIKSPLDYAKKTAKKCPDDIVSLFSLDNLCRYASPSHEAILGVTPEDAIGRPWTDFVSPEDHSHAQLAGDDAMLNGQSIEFGFRAQAKSGERVPLRGIARIIVDPANRQPYLLFHAQVVKG
jgi:PAS domain S-box-containing protein